MCVRTRFAPSPTGYMHIGNLRTALYEYLISKSQNGKFILRIEDTDQNRLIDGAEEVIYKTLETVGIFPDESPKIGGNYGPYKQSERKNIYLKHAEELVKNDKAYYCFCEKCQKNDNLESNENNLISGYEDPCRNLSKNQVQELLSQNKKYVIRQKVNKTGKTSFRDLVFGEIQIENKEIEDQILIKSDKFPTYNFANVIDDHEMKITHVVRGSEYLSSTPKYNLLYQDFGWEIPEYIHLPLIMGQNPDGTTSKLSKRHGAVSFEDLVNMGYLPEAIINYIVFLGWCPSDNQEIFSLQDLTKTFSINNISKSPSVFDYKKLDWFNSEYIKLKSEQEFVNLSLKYINKNIISKNLDINKICKLIKNRISKLDEIPNLIDFFENICDYDTNLFEHKKSKSTLESSLEVLNNIINLFKNLNNWDYENIYNLLINYANNNNLKNSVVMWPVRIGVSGKLVTPGGAVEILEILGKEESLNRLSQALDKLKNTQKKINK